MDNIKMITKLQKNMKVIWSDVKKLLLHRDIFNNIKMIVEENNKINIKNPFHDFIIDIYKDSMIMAVCKQTEDKEDFCNLIKLLRNLTMNTFSRHITKKWFINLCESENQDICENLSIQFFNNNGLNIENINNDLEKLLDSVKNIRIIRNDKIAHRKKNKYNHHYLTPSKELEDSIDIINKLTNKYGQLLNILDAPYCLDSNWKEIFTVPWINPIPNNNKKKKSIRLRT